MDSNRFLWVVLISRSASKCLVNYMNLVLWEKRLLFRKQNQKHIHFIPLRNEAFTIMATITWKAFPEAGSIYFCSPRPLDQFAPLPVCHQKMTSVIAGQCLYRKSRY